MMNINTSTGIEEIARSSMISKTYIWWLVFNGSGYTDEWLAKEDNCPYCDYSGYGGGYFIHLRNQHYNEKMVIKLDCIYKRVHLMQIDIENCQRKDIDEVIQYFSNQYDLRGSLCMEY